MLQSQIHCQQQILSAEMRQSLKILQLPMAGLQAELIQFAEENPVRRPMKMILLRLLMAVQYNIRKPFQSM